MFRIFFSHKIPHINIQYGKLLDPIFNFYLKNNPDLKESGWNDWVPPTREVISEKIKNYRTTWSVNEKQIITSICKMTSLSFNRDVIDVYIVSGNNRQLSNPIIIKSGFNQDDFLENLTHELIHRLFNINSQKVYKNIFKEMFPNEAEATQNHIVIHALLKYVYIEVLKNETQINNSVKKTKNVEYLRAWNIVNEVGYQNLIKDFVSKIIK